MYKIKFGTDGWRGRIAEEYTFHNLRRCAQGVATYLQDVGLAERGLVIGYDQRFLADHFARAAAEVLAANGIRVWLTSGATPTPTISYSVVDKQAGGAINITASHNSPEDCGFKVRGPNGSALPPLEVTKLEERIPTDSSGIKRMKLDDALSDGLVSKFDPRPAYTKQLHRLIDLESIKAAGLKVLVDCMWGNGIGWFSSLLAGGKTTVVEVHNERHPIFPQMVRPEPVVPNVNHGLSFVPKVGADVAIITDGDADRVGLSDEQGHLIDSLRVYALLAYYFLEVRGERGAIVKTISSTKMLNKLAKLYNVPVYETKVGVKYVAPKMMEVDALIGGEESGGYIFRGHVPERDGILAGLFLLDMIVKTGLRPSQLLDQLFELVGAHYYKRIDSRFDRSKKAETQALVSAAQPSTIGGMKVVDKRTISGTQFIMEDGGWLLIRFSGTEPVIRIYCETTNENQIEAILADGTRIAGLSKIKAL